MFKSTPSAAEMNEVAKQFYANLWKRFDNPVIAQSALGRVRSELARDVDGCKLINFEAAISDAIGDLERSRDYVRREDGASGGRPKGADALQRLIVELVRAEPSMKCPGLLQKLKDEVYGGLIDAVENGLILFRADNGTQRKARMTGLKDRFARAKKEVAARKPV